MSTTTITTDTENSIHEYTKWDMSIDINVKLSDINSATHDDLAEAYHKLVRIIAERSTDFDTVTTCLASTFRQHMTNPGPF